MLDQYLDEEVAEHEARVKAIRERYETQREANLQSMQAMEEKMLMMQDTEEKEISAAMQAFETKATARRAYHEAPNDVFEMILLQFHVLDDDNGERGCFNILRLVSKRCLQVVESMTTRLTSLGDSHSLPLSALRRCSSRIEHISCHGSITSLEGCPQGLKSLVVGTGVVLGSLSPLSLCKMLDSIFIAQARNISDLSPLPSCTRLRKLTLKFSAVVDLSPLLSMPSIEELDLGRMVYNVSIQDLSPLSQCKKLKMLDIAGNAAMKDLTPLSHLPDLEHLIIAGLYGMTDLSCFENGFTKLRVLNIDVVPVDDLSPLSRLQNLEELHCYRIPSTTSLLPLARCYKLKNCGCLTRNKDRDELMIMRPDLQMFVFS